MKKEEISALKAGVFVILGTALLIAAIFLLGQRAQLFVPQYRLITTFQNAAGLLRGASVRVAGVNVGHVRSIDIVATTDGRGTARVELEIAREYQRFIRADSRASVRTLGALGDRYVEITVGSLEQPPLNAQDRIASDEGVDLFDIAERVQQLLHRVNVIADVISSALTEIQESNVIADVRAASSSLRKTLETVEKGPGLAHSVIHDRELPATLADLSAAARALRASAEAVKSGQGLAGALIHDEKTRKSLDDVLAAATSLRNILNEVETGEGMAHALIYDKGDRQPLDQLGNAAQRLDSILAQIQEAEGTLGLLINDPSIWESFQRLLGGAEESRTLRFLIRRGLRSGEERAEKQTP